MRDSITIIPIKGLPLLRSGDDLVGMILDSLYKVGSRVMDGDILVVGQKAVSKVEDRILTLNQVHASKRASTIGKATGRNPKFVQLVLSGSKRVDRAGRDALIVTTKQGFTCLNAGVDKSNVEGEETYALLPQNPDRSALQIRKRLRRVTGKNVGVIICDTNSRPFRRGQVEHAIGIAGLEPLVDYRGGRDLFGYELKFKNVAVADELASAAELVMGQGTEMVPAALIKGVKRVKLKNATSISPLVVTKREDLFRGTL